MGNLDTNEKLERAYEFFTNTNTKLLQCYVKRYVINYSSFTMAHNVVAFFRI